MIWWGNYEIPLGKAGLFHLGPLSLWVRRRPSEWRVSWLAGRDALVERFELQVPVDDVEPPPEATTRRYATNHPSERIELMPALMDRPVVVRPEIPLELLPHEEVTLYMGTPVCVRLRLPDTGIVLDEVPTFRNSDTWFGRNSMVGELCYASRIAARLHLEKFAFRSARATTAVRLRNRDRDHERLLVDRFSLPVPSLHLFRDRNGRLWTETVAVELEHERGRTEVMVRLESRPPAIAEDAVPLTPPRTPPERNVLVRAYEALFG